MAAAELRRRLGPGSRVAVFAVDPGESTTGIVQNKWIKAAYNLVLPWILITPAEGASLCPGTVSTLDKLHKLLDSV